LATKPKMNQKEKVNESQKRDFFRTPRYAVELLQKFIPTKIKSIWECASGEYHISNVLEEFGYEVLSTDIINKNNYFNFILHYNHYLKSDAIITNPPFSLKQKFYQRCKEYKIPFALLIPADYSKWIIDAIRFDGCEKIIPTRRIDYITPNNKQGKNSTSQFHSMWLTWGFQIGKTETFVDLSLDMKKSIE